MLYHRYTAAISLLVSATTVIAQPVVPFDANGDGVHDTLVRNAAAAALEVRSGAGGGVLRTFTSSQTEDAFGSVFSVVPDINGDGSPDVLIAAPAHRLGGVVRGAIHAYSLASGAHQWTFVPSVGVACCDVLNWVPDQDRDGAPDALVRRARAEAPGVPEVTLLSGATGEVIALRSGTVGGLAAWAHAGGLLFVPTDVDDSGAVDDTDVGIFAGWYLSGDPRADVNGDGVVTLADLSQMMDDFGAGLTTVKALAIPPQEEPDPEGGIAPVLSGETCGCTPNPATACANVSVAIEGCSSTAWVWDGVYGMRAQASPPGGVFTWEVVSGDVQILDTNAESATFRVIGTTDGIARIRVTYRVTLGDGTVCEVCSCCDQPYGCTCASDVDVIDWDGPILNTPPNPVVCDDLTTLPDAVVVGLGQRVAITLGGSPFGGVYAWQLESTDPINWPVQLLQTGQYGERAIITPPGASAGQAVIAFGYAGGGCCPKFCRVRLSWTFDTDGDGIADDIENASPCLDANDADTDNDGFDDGQELRLGTDPCDADSRPDDTSDIDRDGLRDIEEIDTLGTDHTVFDSDDDGVQDLAEAKLGLDPLSISTDGSTLDVRAESWLARDRDRDGIFDEFESGRGLDPFDPDQDRDGVRDGVEMRRGLDPFTPDQGPGYPGPWVDSDQDYLGDDIERRLGTDPSRSDTDRDGVSDGNEARMGLNPNRRDTDRDGVEDGAEDWDGDGLSNADEDARGTDPSNADSDNDGMCDRTDAQPLGQIPASEYSRFLDANGETCSLVIRVQLSCGYTGTVTFGGHSAEVPMHECGQTIDVPFEVGRWYEYSVFARYWMGRCAHPPFDGVLCSPPGVAYCRTMLDFGLAVALPGQECGVPPTLHREIETLDNYGYQCEDQPVPRSFRYRVRWTLPNVAVADLDFDGVIDTWDTNGDGVADDGDRVISVNVHVDSDNNNGMKPPDCRRGASGDGCDPATHLEDDIEDCPTRPGKIVLASTWDSDGDNIPDYADGLDLLPDTMLDDPENAGFSMIPVDVEVTGVGGSASTRQIRFSYSASNPAGVSDGTDGRPVFSLPPDVATHNLRLWAHLSEEAPSTPPSAGQPGEGTNGPLLVSAMPGQPGAPCWRPPDSQRGLEWIDPVKDYELSRFAVRPNGKIRLWLQAVGPSSNLGQQITVSLVGDSQVADTVRVTAVERRIVPINPDGTLGAPMRFVPVSKPTPFIQWGSQTQPGLDIDPVVNVDPNDPSRLLVRVRLRGTIDDAASDLIPGDPGRIERLGLMVNGAHVLAAENGEEPAPRMVPVTVQKQASPPANAPAADLWMRPYDYSGTFETAFFDAPAEPGWNTIRVHATNAYGQTGFAEAQFNLQITSPPPDERLEVELTLSTLNAQGHPVPPVPWRHRFYPLNAAPPGFTPGSLPVVDADRCLTNGSDRVRLMGPLSLNPGEVDSAPAMLDYLHATPPLPRGQMMYFKETTASSEVFAAGKDFNPENRVDWRGYIVSPAEKRLIAPLERAPVKPFTIEVAGGGNPAGIVREIEINGTRYAVRPDGQMRYVVADKDRLLFRAFLAVDRIGVDMMPPLMRNQYRPVFDSIGRPEATSEDEWNYIRAMPRGGAGMLSDLLDGVLKLSDKIEVLSTDYHSAGIVWRYFNDQNVIVAQDAKEIKSGVESVIRLKAIKDKLDQDGGTYALAFLMGDDEETNRLGMEYREYARMAVEVLEYTADVVDSMPEEQRGEVVGRILAEVVSVFVGPETVVAGAASKAALLPIIAGRVKTAMTVLNGLHKISDVQHAMLVTRLDELTRLAPRLAVPGKAAREILSAMEDAVRVAPGLRCWEAFEQVMSRVRQLENAGNKVSRADVLDAAEMAAKVGFREGNPPSVQRVRQALAGFLDPMDLETQHTIPKKWLRELVAHRDHGAPWGSLDSAQQQTVQAATEAIQDQMPGYPLKRTWHNFGQGELGPDGVREPTFHDMLGDGNVPTNQTDILTSLESAYRDFNEQYGEFAEFDFNLLWQQGREWLQTQGLAP